MTSDKTYNGWTNYETWNMALWVDNEEPIYREKMKLIRRWAPDLCSCTVEDFCKEMFGETGTPDFDGPEDYDKVNWQEIAEHWNEEE